MVLGLHLRDYETALTGIELFHHRVAALSYLKVQQFEAMTPQRVSVSLRAFSVLLASDPQCRPPTCLLPCLHIAFHYPP